MKTINEIIDDLVDFAVENNVLGDGKVDIKIGDLRIRKHIPIIDCGDMDEEVPTVEKIIENSTDEEVPTVEKIIENSTDEELVEAEGKAKKRFSSDDFDKMFEKYNTELMDPNK